MRCVFRESAIITKSKKCSLGFNLLLFNKSQRLFGMILNVTSLSVVRFQIQILGRVNFHATGLFLRRTIFLGHGCERWNCSVICC